MSLPSYGRINFFSFKIYIMILSLYKVSLLYLAVHIHMLIISIFFSEALENMMMKIIKPKILKTASHDGIYRMRLSKYDEYEVC